MHPYKNDYWIINEIQEQQLTLITTLLEAVRHEYLDYQKQLNLIAF